MTSKRMTPARPGAPKPAASRRRLAIPPPPPFARRVAKRLLAFYDLPKPQRSRAYNAWLNSAGTPKRKAERKKQLRQLLGWAKAVAKQITPRQRAAARALGNTILSKPSRTRPAKPKP